MYDSDTVAIVDCVDSHRSYRTVQCHTTTTPVVPCVLPCVVHDVVNNVMIPA